MAALQQQLQSGSETENGNSAPIDEVVGFICGTLTAAERLTHRSMQHHEKEGRTLCIHSVSTATLHIIMNASQEAGAIPCSRQAKLNIFM